MPPADTSSHIQDNPQSTNTQPTHRSARERRGFQVSTFINTRFVSVSRLSLASVLLVVVAPRSRQHKAGRMSFRPQQEMKSPYQSRTNAPSPSTTKVGTVNNHLGRKKKDASANNGWRRYGLERRKQLIEQDKAEGGNSFNLNFQCRIHGYFALAEKVSR